MSDDFDQLMGEIRAACLLAGAMGGKRGDSGSMAERVARTQGGEAYDAVPVRPPAPGAKHCWVQTEHGREPGLRLEWNRTEHGLWEG